MKAVFLTGAILFGAASAITLLPVTSSKISDLGYYALCPFAPWSTLLLLLLVVFAVSDRRIRN